MNMIYKIRTEKTVDEAILNLKKALSDAGFGVLWEFSFKDKMIEKGIDFAEEFKILEVCNPQKAKDVLDVSLEMGFFLPCKLAVYTEKGETFVGMPKPTDLMSMTNLKGLDAIAGEVEDILKTAIEQVR